MTFTPTLAQCEVHDLVTEWLDDALHYGGPQVFRLFGYAGTGKTSLAMHMVDDRSAAFCAFTGKAASRLRAKGCAGATTVHRTIYKIVRESGERPVELILQEARMCGAILTPDDKRVLIEREHALPRPLLRELRSRRDEILALLRAEDEQDEAGDDAKTLRKRTDTRARLVFDLRDLEELEELDVIVLDECSMIGRELWRDLLGFGRPILAIGDPGQLPPIEGTSPITEHEPDAMLEEILRQAEGSEILDLATAVRQGERPGAVGGEEVKKMRWPDVARMLDVDQVLCGTNTRRTSINRQFRELLGYARQSTLPVEGEKLVCLRNQHDLGIMNGEQFRVLSCEQTGDGRFVDLELVRWDEPDDLIRCVATTETFDSGKPQLVSRKVAQFDYGYALTVHKAQGSEWDSVMVLDESWLFGGEQDKWLYTAVTRAKRELIVVTSRW